MGMIDHVGREVTIEKFGKQWTFARWTRRVWVDLTNYAQKNLPNPLLEANAVLPQFTAQDAATLRELIKADMEEAKAAAAEGREPISLANGFRPASDMLVEKAMQRRSLYLESSSPEMKSFLGSIVGISYALYLLLREHHPDITEDDAYLLATAFQPDELKNLIETTQGKSRALPKNE